MKFQYCILINFESTHGWMDGWTDAWTRRKQYAPTTFLKLGGINTRLFVDDCIIYKKINSMHDSQQLQHDLHCPAQWETNWRVTFHPDKCNLLRFTRRKHPFSNSYSLKGCQLEEVTTAKYLGVDMSNNLLWKDHIDQIVKKVRKTTKIRNQYNQ